MRAEQREMERERKKRLQKAREIVPFLISFIFYSVILCLVSGIQTFDSEQPESSRATDRSFFCHSSCLHLVFIWDFLLISFIFSPHRFPLFFSAVRYLSFHLFSSFHSHSFCVPLFLIVCSSFWSRFLFFTFLSHPLLILRCSIIVCRVAIVVISENFSYYSNNSY